MNTPIITRIHQESHIYIYQESQKYISRTSNIDERKGEKKKKM
jgi:hypothetical protein